MSGKITLTGRFARQANSMLRKVAGILDRQNIPYVLEAGTLLGIVRENRLLPWDNDMDITITSQYTELLLKNRWRFYLAGYRVQLSCFKKDIGPFKKGMPRILKIQKKYLYLFNGAKLLDIFIKYPVGDEYQWTVSQKYPVLKGAPKNFYDEFTRLEYKGFLYSVPKDYIGYLEYHYGDWQTPKKEWNFRTDDHCVKKVY